MNPSITGSSVIFSQKTSGNQVENKDLSFKVKKEEDYIRVVKNYTFYSEQDLIKLSGKDDLEQK